VVVGKEKGHAEGALGGAPGRVAVVGGGIAGLASAYFLARGGARVTVLEASDAFGGLGGTFPYRDVHLERFYHCILPTDQELLALLDALGLTEELYWHGTSFAVHTGGRLYPMNHPRDVLGFRALSLLDRLRLGVTGLFARLSPPRGLDDITCEAWLGRLSGKRAFSLLWRPLLEAKFGDHYREVPALWFWTRFNRDKGAGGEVKGYVRGGYRRITETLVAALKRGGHVLRLQAPVKALDLDEGGRPRLRVAQGDWETFDRLVFTAPLPYLRGIAGDGRLAGVLAGLGEDVDMVGVLNAVFMLRRSLSPHYWIAATEAGSPFQGVVETTNLIDRGDIADAHLVYALRYLHRSDAWFAAADELVLDASFTGLQRLFPELEAGDVLARHVFRTPFVEPIYTLGYLSRRPPNELVPGRIYLATTTQVYPGVTSWNASVGLAGRVVAGLLGGARA